MKKAFIISMLIFLITGILVWAQGNDDYDIRKLKWWMSYDEVVANEKLEDSLYKEETLLGMPVEIVFGCNNKGLYSVTYSTEDPQFAEKVIPVLNRKYGKPVMALDYSFLVNDAKAILEQYPKIVVAILDNNDYSLLNTIEYQYDSEVDARKILKGGLTKRQMWMGGNTVASLLQQTLSTVLSYRPKDEHDANKKKFDSFYKALKDKVLKKKKQSESDENF